eukprot:21144_1
MVKTGCKYCCAKSFSLCLPYCPGDIYDYPNDDITARYNAMDKPEDVLKEVIEYYDEDARIWDLQTKQYKQHYCAANDKLEQHGMEFMIGQEWDKWRTFCYKLLEVMWLYSLIIDFYMPWPTDATKSQIFWGINFVNIIAQMITWILFNVSYHEYMKMHPRVGFPVYSIPVLDFCYPTIWYDIMQQGLKDRDSILGVIKVLGLVYDGNNLHSIPRIISFVISIIFSSFSLYLNRKRVRCIIKYGFKLPQSFITQQ